jgi:predicted metalloendopeptidase
VSADEKNSKINRCSIGFPQLTAYDYDIYIEDAEDDQNTKKYKKEFKSKFLQFAKKMFDACLGPNHGLKGEDVWDIEYEIMMSLGCGKVKNESSEFYNIVKSNEALSKYGFDWPEFSKKIGFSKTPSFFICVSLNYLKCIMDTLNEKWKTPQWRTYYIYIYLKQIIRFHNKFRPIYYDFFMKFVKGQPSIWPQEIYPVFGLSVCFNTFLTNEYVARNQKQIYINFVNNLGNDLLTVFKRIIKRNNWLSPETKKYALPENLLCCSRISSDSVPARSDLKTGF